MKGFFKKFAAVALAGIMTLGISTAAAATNAATEGTTGVTGDGTVTDIIYNVLITEELDFEMNKYMYEASPGDLVIPTSQITAPQFPMENQTPGMHVEITYDLVLTLASGVSLTTAAAADPADKANTAKTAYFAAIGASEASGTVLPNNNTVFNFDVAEEGVMAPFAKDETSNAITASISFALQPYTGTTSDSGSAITAYNVAAFTFYGLLNSNATWANGDFTISGECTLSGMSASTYEGLEDDIVGLNQIAGTPVDTDEIGDGFLDDPDALGLTAGKPLTFARSNAAPAGNKEINFFGAETAVTNMYTPSGKLLVKGTDYSLEEDKIVLIRTNTASTFNSGSATAKTFTFDYEDGDGEEQTVSLYIVMTE